MILKNKVYKNTSFNNLQKLENKDGFIEASKNNNFFRKGTSGQWKNTLSKSQKELIEGELNAGILCRASPLAAT